MNNLVRKFCFFALTLAALFLSACASAINISENLSPAEIIQRGQEALDKNRYNIAVQYYEALYQRNQTNIDLIITAEYHIANIHYKQGKYDTARTELNAILEYYNTPDEELLPQHYKRLSQIVLERIDEKEKPRATSRKKEKIQELE